MRGSIARYARSGAWSTVAYAVQVVGALALSIVVVRALGETRWGVLSEVRQLVRLSTVLGGMALERSLLRFLPEVLQEGNERTARSLFWKTLGLRVIFWVPLLGATWWFGEKLETLFKVPLAATAMIGVGTSLLFSLYNHVRAAATARFETRTVAVATGVGSMATLVGTTWALWRGAGVDAVLIMAGAGMLLAALIQLPAALGWGNGREGSMSSRPDGESPSSFSLRQPRFVRYALPFAGVALLNYVVHSATEVFFLGHYQGPVLAGFYVLGFTFAQRFIDFLPMALWEVSMAGFTEVTVQDAARLPGALTGYIKLLYLFLLPLACLGVAFSPSLIRVLYGEAMLPAALVSQAYFVVGTVAAVGAPVGMIVYARDRTFSALKAYLVFATVNIVLDFVLIPPLGLWGAILGLGLAKLTSVGLMSRIAWDEVPQLTIPWSFLARALLASLPILLWLLVPPSGSRPFPVLAGGAAALLVLLLGLRVWKVIGSEEAELIERTGLPFRRPFLRLLGAGISGPNGNVSFRE